MRRRPRDASAAEQAGSLEALLAAEHMAGRELALARAEADGVRATGARRAEAIRASVEERLAERAVVLRETLERERAATAERTEARRRAVAALLARWDDDACRAAAEAMVARLLAEETS